MQEEAWRSLDPSQFLSLPEGPKPPVLYKKKAEEEPFRGNTPIVNYLTQIESWELIVCLQKVLSETNLPV